MPELVDDEQRNLELDRAINFNEFLRLPEAFDEYLDELTKLILTYHGVKNRTEKTVAQAKLATDIFLANLLLGSVTSNERLRGHRWSAGVVVPKQMRMYTNSRYRVNRPGYRAFVRVWTFFSSDKIGAPVDVVDGFFDRREGGGSRITRMRLEYDFYSFFFRSPVRPDKFPYQFPQPPEITDSEIGYPFDAFRQDEDTEVVRLKNEQKELIDYADDEYTNSARDHLREWNLFALQFHADVLLSDQEFQAVELDVEDEESEGNSNGRIVLQKKQLYRIFNNGSFDQGGRLYGGWWQEIPSDLRRYITIDGMRTVEIDYSNMQPAMLYAIEGELLPNDAYSIDGVDPSFRKLIKKTFMKLLNAMPGQNIRAPRRNELPEGMTFSDLMELLKERHEPIERHFRSGIGLKLQRDDSDIAQEIITEGMKNYQLILPIHDSFIVQKKHYGYALRGLMLEKYAERYGRAIGVDVDEPFALKPEIAFFDEGILEAPKIDEAILKERGEWLREQVKAGAYSGYRERNQLDDAALENWPIDAH